VTAAGSLELRFPPFRLDPLRHAFRRGTEALRLRPKTFAVLQYLAENPARLVTREELIEAVWEGAVVSESLLRGYVRELRSLLGDNSNRPQYIETVPGRGYRFIAPVSREREDAADSPPARTPSRTARPTIVGRDAELTFLGRCCELSLSGQPQLILITGEPGIGKTSLVDAFLERAKMMASRPLIARGQCVDHFGSGEPYLPVLDALEALLQEDHTEPPEQRP